MRSASYPSAVHTSTHSAHPLHLVGSMKMPNNAPSSPFRAGTSKYFRVRTHWAPSNSGSPSSREAGIALARIAVSGHSVTQVMQPTHRSAMNSGISGER